MIWVQNASPEVDAQSEWPLIVAVCITLSTIMTMCVALRLYVRTYMIKSLGTDDYVIIFSMLCGISYAGLCIGQTRWGLGLPISLRPASNLNKYSEINFAGRPIYMAGITGFKVALCLAYLRITGGRTKKDKSRYRTFIYAMLTFAVLSHLGGTLVLLFQCSPVHKSWRPRTEGKCLDNVITFYVLAAITILCDIIIILLPVPLLLKIKMNSRKKIGLIAVFSLGLFTTICSIMRMVQIEVIAKNGNSTRLVLWGTVELNVGIFLTCLPTLTPLVTWFANKSRKGTYEHSYGQYGPGRSHAHTGSGAIKLGSVNRTLPVGVMSKISHSSRTDSEETILPIHGADDQHIMKTTTVEIKSYPD
ncbi:uncharacterized protein HMPREF1541_10194 [Cyphellophora europaea CBS 101466]|uniref:Rhodopsin domain-containing protein n=1 Tax=Cyphellophora europaea (strain CBS 101466) TaxID=1220924 RepID=W2S9E3_CYPE1|nr:uncharacterized protein HMPREF1541_10194 [Cyphellophora europaea CBS 101466]ETN44524.1 hypothetical protein HMPREF1541_10194 [Cyphellophora europaea CBS 101466]